MPDDVKGADPGNKPGGTAAAVGAAAGKAERPFIPCNIAVGTGGLCAYQRGRISYDKSVCERRDRLRHCGHRHDHLWR